MFQFIKQNKCTKSLLAFQIIQNLMVEKYWVPINFVRSSQKQTLNSIYLMQLIELKKLEMDNTFLVNQVLSLKIILAVLDLIHHHNDGGIYDNNVYSINKLILRKTSSSFLKKLRQ
ncbi:unnamed protein product [Paramecium sonneborni]|uniref:Uncharacterized protein n=1 Tax=Paramecium sonneborni TaxID=65129 RepID=A0A8S1K659_9CILI|nr:unnamed protein product [Paramecium sonneborni]